MKNDVEVIWFTMLGGGQVGVHPENGTIHLKDGPEEAQGSTVLLHVVSEERNYEIDYLSNKGGISRLRANKLV